MENRKDEITIRTAVCSDLRSIVELTEKEFRSASIDAKIEDIIGGIPWIETKAAVLKSELENNPDGCFVAVLDGKVVGYITTVIVSIASRGVVANIAVSSKLQGMGIGRKLIGRAIEHFGKLGLHQAKIETLATNQTGQHLYPSLGFREVERQIHYVMPLAEGKKD
ncbi:MAG: GNAT family N-acetyltransferase [Victivallales bacterium]|jgi:phosphinothricin acetyltransferase